MGAGNTTPVQPTELATDSEAARPAERPHQALPNAMTRSQLGRPASPEAQTTHREDGEASTRSAMVSTDAGSSSTNTQQTESQIAIDIDASESSQTECIICLTEMNPEEEQCTTLVCGHRFHESCVNEWLDKDGRCPVCRRRIREPPQARPDDVDPQVTNRQIRLLANAALLTIESRRLMMLATMEGLLAVRTAPCQPHERFLPCAHHPSTATRAARMRLLAVLMQVLLMSYVVDLVSPILMASAAASTFAGASQYRPRIMRSVRFVLIINAIYHTYMVRYAGGPGTPLSPLALLRLRSSAALMAVLF